MGAACSCDAVKGKDCNIDCEQTDTTVEIFTSTPRLSESDPKLCGVTNRDENSRSYLGAAPEVREVKVLPPIRGRKVSTMPEISYQPRTRWGGSVPAYFEATNREVQINERLTFGNKTKPARRLNSITKHERRRKSDSGEVFWEENVTVLSEKSQPEKNLLSADDGRWARFRRRSRRKSSLKLGTDSLKMVPSSFVHTHTHTHTHIHTYINIHTYIHTFIHT